MSKSTSTKGGAKLASVLQQRMNRTAGKSVGMLPERGEIVEGNKLKIYSLPDAILDQDDYSVCINSFKSDPLRSGDCVLIVWTIDNEPVVVDRIKEADSL